MSSSKLESLLVDGLFFAGLQAIVVAAAVAIFVEPAALAAATSIGDDDEVARALLARDIGEEDEEDAEAADAADERDAFFSVYNRYLIAADEQRQ